MTSRKPGQSHHNSRILKPPFPYYLKGYRLMSQPPQQLPQANSPYEVHRTVLPVVLNERNLLGEGAEVGVRRGDFSAHILRQWKGSKLWLIDAWLEVPGYEEAHHDHEQNYKATLDNMRAFPGRYEI